jgi:predicted DNA-binding ribbon-helix-helix protein
MVKVYIKQASTRLEKKDWERLKETARKHRKSVARLIREAVQRHLWGIGS